MIFAFTGYDQADLDTFATTFGLPKFTPILVGGQPGEPSGETPMDLQIAHAIAPDAQKLSSTPVRPWRATAATRRSVRCWRRRIANSRARCGASPSAGAATSCSPPPIWLRYGPPWPPRSRTAPRHSTPAATSPGWNARADRTGRHRRATPISGWTRSRRCPRRPLSVAPPCPPTPTAGGWPNRPGLTCHCPKALAAEYQRCSTVPNGSGVSPDQDTEKRLTPDVAAVADPFTGVRIVFKQQQLVGGGTRSRHRSGRPDGGDESVPDRQRRARDRRFQSPVVSDCRGRNAAGLSRRDPRRQCGPQRRARLRLGHRARDARRRQPCSESSRSAEATA